MLNKGFSLKDIILRVSTTSFEVDSQPPLNPIVIQKKNIEVKKIKHLLHIQGLYKMIQLIRTPLLDKKK